MSHKSNQSTSTPRTSSTRGNKRERQVVEQDQLKRFRKAAREADVDPEADIDEVMKRLAAQKKLERTAKKVPPNTK